MKNKSPLVSVLVISYNSTKYIIDTLESIIQQTYQNIELIISDDCSTDKTVELCQNWINNNKERFVKCKIITSPVNTGISPNINRAIRAAKGIWIKSIAGDDLLMPNCIEDNINYIKKNPDVFIVQSESKYINGDSKEIIKATKVKSRFKNKRISAYYQHRLSLFTSNLNIQTLFIKKELYNYIGEYDETIPMMEDRPFYLNATEHGFKIHYFPKITAVYRIHSQSVFNLSLEHKIINNNRLIPLEVSEKYVYPHLSKFGLFIYEYLALLTRKFYNSRFNKKHKFNLLLWTILKSPHSIYCRLKILMINKKIDVYLKKQN